jgi:hypothetical protein
MKTRSDKSISIDRKFRQFLRLSREMIIAVDSNVFSRQSADYCEIATTLINHAARRLSVLRAFSSASHERGVVQNGCTRRRAGRPALLPRSRQLFCL